DVIAKSMEDSEKLIQQVKYSHDVRGCNYKLCDTTFEHQYQSRINGVLAGSAGMDAFDAFFTSESFELLSDGNRRVRSRCRKLRDLFYIQLIRIYRRNSRGTFLLVEVITLLCARGRSNFKFDDGL